MAVTKYTNGCKLDVLRIWGANIHLQYVVDEYSAVMFHFWVHDEEWESNKWPLEDSCNSMQEWRYTNTNVENWKIIPWMVSCWSSWSCHETSVNVAHQEKVEGSPLSTVNLEMNGLSYKRERIIWRKCLMMIQMCMQQNMHVRYAARPEYVYCMCFG